jgi:hypothetical protein
MNACEDVFEIITIAHILLQLWKNEYGQFNRSSTKDELSQ